MKQILVIISLAIVACIYYNVGYGGQQGATTRSLAPIAAATMSGTVPIALREGMWWITETHVLESRAPWDNADMREVV